MGGANAIFKNMFNLYYVEQAIRARKDFYDLEVGAGLTAQQGEKKRYDEKDRINAYDELMEKLEEIGKTIKDIDRISFEITNEEDWLGEYICEVRSVVFLVDMYQNHYFPTLSPKNISITTYKQYRSPSQTLSFSSPHFQNLCWHFLV